MGEKQRARIGRSRLFDIESPLAIELRRIMIRLSRTVDFEQQRCLMVTSAQRGEGKSLFCSHFALVLANHLKKRILLIDGDLRRPVQHSVYNVPRAPGFAEQLRGEAVTARRTALANLQVLPAGRAGDEVSALISGSAVREAIAHWRGECDVIVLDSPPVVPVSDPLQYVEAVDGVIYMLMAGRTPRDVVTRGVEILRGVGANILGVVANNHAEVLPYYYDRKYYGYAERKQRQEHEMSLVAAPAREEAAPPEGGGGQPAGG